MKKLAPEEAKVKITVTINPKIFDGLEDARAIGNPLRKPSRAQVVEEAIAEWAEAKLGRPLK